MAPARSGCDLAGSALIRQCLGSVRPHIIVNAAAYTNVELAESESDLAMAINGDGPAILAEMANALGALLVHYSSDYVFDGRLGRPYIEADGPGPLNEYGRSKLAGERGAAKADRHLILRTSWVHGADGSNFLKTMLGLMMQRQSLNVVADQVGIPTSVDLLAEVTAQLLTRYLRDAGGAPGSTAVAGRAQFPFGLYHVAASGQASWYDYARLIAELAASRGVPLALGTQDIHPIKAADWPSRVVRPADSRLDTERLRSVFGVQLPSWQEGVAVTMTQLLQGGHLCVP